MSFDRDSILRPLRAAEGDLAVLRGGPADDHERARAVVRVAAAVETALRRFLRDDPTAPVELRLRALSPDDLPQDELLAELRRRNRLPVELAASVHHLAGAATHIARGAGAAPQDAELAVAVAAGLESHLASLPPDLPLEDPVTEPEENLLAPPEAEEEPARAAVPVPPATWGRSLRIVGIAAAGLLVVLLAVWGIRSARQDDRLREGETALRQGRTAEAERSFRAYAADHLDEPLPRVYLARIYREAGRRADAARELKAALAASPGDYRAQTELGLLLLEEGRPADAVRAFRIAVGSEPQAAAAWVGLVRAMRATGQNAAAEQVLRMAPPEVQALLSREAAPPAPDTTGATAPSQAGASGAQPLP